MKRFPHLLTVASVAVVLVLTADRAVNASDKQTLDIFAKTALAQRKPASGHPYEVSIAQYA